MKANELRIGNYVNRLGEPTIIEAIQKGVGIDYVSTPKSGVITINQIEPIPLIDEILLKCEGVVVVQRGTGQEMRLIVGEFEDWDLILVFVNGVCKLRDFEGSLFFEVEYLHQLQNLYFMFYKKELKINL